MKFESDKLKKDMTVYGTHLPDTVDRNYYKKIPSIFLIQGIFNFLLKMSLFIVRESYIHIFT